MTTTKNNLDPRTWSKRNKIIAAIAASVAVILTIAVFGSQSHNAKDCTSYQQILTDKTAQLDQAIQDANDALKTVDASLKPGEGTRLAHTDGFPLSSEGQSAINDLSKAISAAKSAKEAEDAKATDAAADNNSKKKQCDKEPDTTSVDAAIKAIKDQTQSFVSVRDAYRLTKATDEANELMDTAKSNLASAQQSAAEQIAAVEADPNMESDTSVKAAYDALKAVETESHTLSTTVTVTTYDEAVASIEKAKTVEQKAAEVTASVAPLQEAITTYQEAKAGSASNASNAPEQGTSTSNAPAPSYGYNGNEGSSNSGSNGSSYSGGSSYTPPAPAPAPAPAPPANNSGSGDGRIDFGPGQADRPGCVIIEGRSVC
jgi:protein P54